MNYLGGLSIGLILSVSLISCSNGQEKTASKAGIAQDVNVEQFVSHLDDAQILDVRTPEEWNEGIIEEAVMANLYDAGFDAELEKLDKDRPVAVYCKSGGRSGQAMDKMNKLGFKEVYNLKGGIGAWKRAGKPTVNP